MSYTLHITYGSESGNAHLLAYNLKRDLSKFKPSYCELNDFDFTTLTNNDLVLIITSTTGDGEAPSNAKQFYRKLVQNKQPLACQFAVFGLGDTNYDNFCGFSIVVDGLLIKQGANSIAKRVDADIDYEEYFELWSQAITSVLESQPNNEKALKSLAALTLQINPNE